MHKDGPHFALRYALCCLEPSRPVHDGLRHRLPCGHWCKLWVIFPFPKAPGLAFIPCTLGSCSLPCHNLLGNSSPTCEGTNLEPEVPLVLPLLLPLQLLLLLLLLLLPSTCLLLPLVRV